jgi:hypothetical protein
MEPDYPQQRATLAYRDDPSGQGRHPSHIAKVERFTRVGSRVANLALVHNKAQGLKRLQAFYSKLLVSREPIGEGTLLRPAGVTMPGPQDQVRRDLNRPIGMWVRASV